MYSARRYTAQGIVLKRKNAGEADRFVTLLTKNHGKIELLAKSIRRVPSRRAGHVEIFSSVRVGVHRGKTFEILTEAEKLPFQPFCARSLIQVSYAYYLCELADRILPERELHENLYHALFISLKDISVLENEEDWGRILQAFALELLWSLGYLPRTTSLGHSQVEPFIENIIERKLKTPGILTKLHGGF